MNMRSDDGIAAFSRLVRALYASLTADQPWYAFLTELRDQMNARYATVIITKSPAAPPSLMVTPHGKPDYIEAYRDHLFRLDPFINLPEGKVVSIHEYLNENILQDSKFYNVYMMPEQTAHILGLDLRAASGFETRIRITRIVGDAPFTDAERARCEMIVPHIRQALDLYQRLETSRSEHAVYSGAVEQFAVGTVILDQQGNVIHCNQIASAILDEKDGIALSGRRIVFDNAGRDAEFRTLIRQHREAGRVAQAPAGTPVFRVERPSGKRDLGIIVRSIDTPDFLHAGSAPAIALFFGDPERQFEVTSEALRELFQLTPTEATISACLANGLSVHECADRLGVATNTVRAHLRSVFAKTGVCRQSQLVHLIHTSLPDLAGVRRRMAS